MVRAERRPVLQAGKSHEVKQKSEGSELPKKAGCGPRATCSGLSARHGVRRLMHSLAVPPGHQGQPLTSAGITLFLEAKSNGNPSLETL